MRVGCMDLHLDESHVHAEAAEQQRALFFDLKLVLGPDLSCLCHKCVSPMMPGCCLLCSCHAASLQNSFSGASSNASKNLLSPQHSGSRLVVEIENYQAFTESYISEQQVACREASRLLLSLSACWLMLYVNVHQWCTCADSPSWHWPNIIGQPVHDACCTVFFQWLGLCRGFDYS